MQLQPDCAAERETALRRYDEALSEWVEACRAVRAHNARILNSLRAKLGDVTLPAWEIEYALVADADDGFGPRVETSRVWAIGGSGDTWTVVESGRPRDWTFRHIVRVGSPVEARPVYPHTDLFRRVRIGPDEYVYIDHSTGHAELVAEARAKARPYPPEPDWQEISGGLPLSGQVYEMSARAGVEAGVRDERITFIRAGI